MPKYIPALTVLLFFFLALPGNAADAGQGGERETIDRLHLGIEKYYAAKDFFYRQRDTVKAKELLGAAEELFGGVEEDFDRYYWLGRAALLKARIKSGQGREEEAEEAFLHCEEAARRALACDRKASEALRLLGEVLLEQNKNDYVFAWAYLPQAFLLLEKAAVLDRENRAARSALAGYYLEAPFLLGGNPQKAIAILEKLPASEDQHEEFLTAYRLGRAYALAGRKEEAAALLKQALSIYPEDPQVRGELVKVRAEEEEKNFRISLYPILPPAEGFVLGGGVLVEYGGFSPYLSGSYDLAEQIVYYSLATRLTLGPTVTADVGYYRKSASYHPGYQYREGAGAGLNWQDGLGSFLGIDIFNGKIGGYEQKPVNTGSLTVTAAKPLYNDWGKLLGLYLTLTAGRVEEENYYIARLQLPVRYNDYRGLLILGYIDQEERTGLHFTNLVRGYESAGGKGSREVLIRLERGFPLFPYSNKPYLGALHGVIFADAGSLFNDRADFHLQKSAGAGLVFHTPLVETRFDLAVREDGRVRPVFAFNFKMF